MSSIGGRQGDRVMYRKFISIVTLTALAVVVFSVDAAAIRKERSRFSLKNRSQIEVRFGVFENANHDDEYYYDGIITGYSNDDLMVSIGYNYWTNENTAISLTVKVLGSEFDDGADYTDAYKTRFAVVPIFLGVRIYPGRPGVRSPIRPYLTAAGGPVFAHETVTLVGGYNIIGVRRTETAAGAHLGAGIDFMAGRHFMLGINAGYNLISDFEDPIDGHVNYSGGEFGVGFGFLF